MRPKIIKNNKQFKVGENFEKPVCFFFKKYGKKIAKNSYKLSETDLETVSKDEIKDRTYYGAFFWINMFFMGNEENTIFLVGI